MTKKQRKFSSEKTVYRLAEAVYMYTYEPSIDSVSPTNMFHLQLQTC